MDCYMDRLGFAIGRGTWCSECPSISITESGNVWRMIDDDDDVCYAELIGFGGT